MTELTIQRLNHRLRLTQRDAPTEARLHRLLATMVDHAFEPALQRQRLATRGELCVRRIDLPPLRLDLRAADAALVERWADAWASGIARRLERRDADIVRYDSRVAALIDLVAAATRGDFARAWAWRQLGLWDADAAVTAADAAGLVMRALVGEARHAAAAIGALAAASPRWLDRWLGRSSGASLRRLALAVLTSAGGDPAALDHRQAAAPAWQGHRQRLLGRSALARGIVRAAPPVAAEAGAALALLAIAEAEPALLPAPAAELGQLIAALAATWTRAGTPAARPETAASLDAPHHDSRVDLPADEARAAASARRPASPPWPRPNGEPARRSAPRPPWVAADDASAIETAAASIRSRAITDHGGLLFVLNLARELDWPERLLHDPALAPRGLRWSLHRLAQTLLPLAPTDAAALALAGLRPDDDPPDRGEPPPSDAEDAALGRLRDEVVAALRRRLRDADPDDARLLAEVCRRRAEVRADPGWIELGLSLDEVRSAIRIAGLDLDPGWLPWLGTVIRFVYE
jgi:hypothetical protein